MRRCGSPPREKRMQQPNPRACRGFRPGPGPQGCVCKRWKGEAPCGLGGKREGALKWLGTVGRTRDSG